MEGIIMTIAYVSIIGFSLTQQKLQANQENVCRNENNPTELYCCYNHHQVEGECKECKNGTVSEDGKVCKKCSKGMYGYRCLRQCKCSKHERCDKVLGCVSTNVIVTDVTGNSSNALTTVSKSEREQTTYLSYSTSQRTGYITSFVVTTSSNIDQSTNIIFYCMLGIGVIIVVLLVCIVVVQICKCSRLKTQDTDAVNVALRNAEADQRMEEMYDEIDDIQELQIMRNSYLSLESEKINSEMNNENPSTNGAGSFSQGQPTSSESFAYNYAKCLDIDVDKNVLFDQTTEIRDNNLGQICSGIDDLNGGYITAIV